MKVAPLGVMRWHPAYALCARVSYRSDGCLVRVDNVRAKPRRINEDIRMLGWRLEEYEVLRARSIYTCSPKFQ